MGVRKVDRLLGDGLHGFQVDRVRRHGLKNGGQVRRFRLKLSRRQRAVGGRGGRGGTEILELGTYRGYRGYRGLLGEAERLNRRFRKMILRHGGQSRRQGPEPLTGLVRIT